MQPKKPKPIKVLYNYGSIDPTQSAFGATPPPQIQPRTPPNFIKTKPPMNMNVQHNMNLTNFPLRRSLSTPVILRSHIKGILKATVNSPMFRPMSPAITKRSMSRNRLSDLIERKPFTADMKLTVEDKSKLMSVWSAGFSIINLFLGLGLLSFPYALAEGSLISLGVLAFICVSMSYTGKLIVRCFDSVPDEERTYPQVGYRALYNLIDTMISSQSSPNQIGNESQPLQQNIAKRNQMEKRKNKWGNFGMGLVTFGIMMEFLGALCMSTIFIWDNLSYLVPSLNGWQLVLICTICVLPTCWFLNFAELRFNSFIGCVCKVVTVIVVVLTFCLDTSVIYREEYDIFPRSPTTLSVSIGIFILSYAGHACLPSIYTSMAEPHRFERVLDICFVIMFFTYSGMALFGYLQFGALTNVLITANLSGSNITGSQLIIARILVGLVIAGCYFQVSPILTVVAEIPEQFYDIKTGMKQRIFRTILFLIICVISWFVLPHLAILEAVTGSLCTMITSVICPALFYYGLNRKSISWMETIILFTYIIFGVVFGTYLLYNDIVAVVTGQQ